jgi:hypothetical protein
VGFKALANRITVTIRDYKQDGFTFSKSRAREKRNRVGYLRFVGVV